MPFDVYCRPDLLQSIREEVRQHAIRVDHQKKTYTIDLAAIRDHCILLVSTFQEMLRVRSSAAPTRFLHDDVLLANKYLFQRGAMLQIPAQCLNQEKSNWGTYAREFNPSRFMGKAKQRSPGYMSPNICPGRNFASGEIGRCGHDVPAV
ncbi:P450 monooxygenase [Penicillium malachiteum]|uniref:P450 monooxygenase n=1 Tax=Penicillium malachiteum TaxID=1324776 RepID=UPI0025499E1F|nr:P450 monooxygenase [Penicillium malachiteum]KAJ5715188.1 P450 monooxygenase [Penicillium malachiteum]